MRRLGRSELAQTLLARLLCWYLQVALRTTRWTVDGVEHMGRHIDGAPAIAAFWHERLPLMPMLWLLGRRRLRQDRRLPGAHVLVSLHRDGRLIGNVVRGFGIDVVHGSSSRGGLAGMRQLLALLDTGDHIGITPDGPRGPRRRAAPGVAQLAALSGVAIVPCAAQTSRRWVLRSSWDQMVVPRPFGRGVLVCGVPIVVDRENWVGAVPAIEAAISAAADRADALCAG